MKNGILCFINFCLCQDYSTYFLIQIAQRCLTAFHLLIFLTGGKNKYCKVSVLVYFVYIYIEDTPNMKQQTMPTKRVFGFNTKQIDVNLAIYNKPIVLKSKHEIKMHLLKPPFHFSCFYRSLSSFIALCFTVLVLNECATCHHNGNSPKTHIIGNSSKLTKH